MPPISATISQIGCVERRRAPSATLLGSNHNDTKAASMLVQKDEEHKGTRSTKGRGARRGTRSLPVAVPQGLMLALWHRLLAWPLPKPHIVCFSWRLGQLNFILWFSARDTQGLSLSPGLRVLLVSWGIITHVFVLPEGCSPGFFWLWATRSGLEWVLWIC